MRLLLLLLLTASFSLLSAQASNADALFKNEIILPQKEFGRAVLNPADKDRSLYEQGEYGRAIHAYDKILQDNPADKEALRHRGLAHMTLGQYKEGQQDFLSCSSDADADSCSHALALGADPSEVAAQALYRKGCLALRNDDCDTAETYFKQALDLFPMYPGCLNMLNLVLGAKENYEDAIEVCSYALSYHPSDFKLWESLSVLCYHQGTYKNSRTAANIALSLSPPKSDQEALLKQLGSDRQEVDAHSLWSSMKYLMENGYSVSDF